MDETFMFVHITHEVNFTIFDTKWLPQTAKFAAIGAKTNGTGGLIKVFELNGKQLDITREISRQNAFKCSAFGLSRTKNYYLAVGDFGGSLQIIDLDRFDVFNIDNAHKGVINAIDAAGSQKNRGATEIVTGGQDGHVKVWDPRCNYAVVQLMPKQGTKRPDCWSVAFGDSYNRFERCVFAGFDNGDIKLFDLRTLKERWDVNVGNGVCGLEMDNKYEPLRKLVACTTFGGIHAYYFDECDAPVPMYAFAKDTISCETNAISDNIRGKTNPTIWCVRHLPQNRDIFATCSSSGMLKVWQSPKESCNFETNSLKVMCKLSLGNKLINCFDWSPDRTGLGVCSSFDKKIRVIASVNMPLGQ
ncbi:WD repeat-containing protein 92-like [Contarinia nasturtii]|uniref:WD repeat-containing protein 92-like n=1 Tax=Contarinia nasturtii TaxID=265458 RepID=UPI0012D45704|nr:WD repeat-containing protein 92-like [Contarinia nasturtii]